MFHTYRATRRSREPRTPTPAWLEGARFKDIALRAARPLDDLLGVQGRVVSFVLQALVEQGVAPLAKLLESQGRTLAPAVLQFPEHLRFGVPTAVAQLWWLAVSVTGARLWSWGQRSLAWV